MQTEKMVEILREIVNEAADEGCEDCFVVSADVIKKAEKILKKWEKENAN